MSEYQFCWSITLSDKRDNLATRGETAENRCACWNHSVLGSAWEITREKNCATMLSRSIILVCCILTCSLVSATRPLSILVIESIPSTSHHVWAMNLIKGLLRKGHHVHAVSIHESKVKGKLAQNLTYAVSRRYQRECINRLFAIYKTNGGEENVIFLF